MQRSEFQAPQIWSARLGALNILHLTEKGKAFQQRHWTPQLPHIWVLKYLPALPDIYQPVA